VPLIFRITSSSYFIREDANKINTNGMTYWYMSFNSQPVSPVQDLLDGIIELQHRLEDLEPKVRSNRAKSQYENVRTKLADSKSAIWALGVALDRLNVG
jgi:predicted FMN-binding regulatory protein PaiB